MFVEFASKNKAENNYFLLYFLLQIYINML